MIRERIIPCLLIQDGGLVKTINFSNPKYIGDPINAIHIFNEKDVDEMIIIDIKATANGYIDFELLEELASEAFMPLTYGGGIKTVEDIKRILQSGYEKVVMNYSFFDNNKLVQEASALFGSQSISVGIDIKRNFLGKYKVFRLNGKEKIGLDPVDVAIMAQQLGAGEIFINNIDKDGTMSGYDIKLVDKITSAVEIPVVACGGAGNINDIAELFRKTRVSGAAVGSLFIYFGKHKAVLINVPSEEEFRKVGLYNGI